MTSLRRCSTRALGRGLAKVRCGSTTSTGSLRPSWPASSRATSVILTLAPAQGCAEKSTVLFISSSPAGEDGTLSVCLGASTSERPVEGGPLRSTVASTAAMP